MQIKIHRSPEYRQRRARETGTTCPEAVTVDVPPEVIAALPDDIVDAVVSGGEVRDLLYAGATYTAEHRRDLGDIYDGPGNLHHDSEGEDITAEILAAMIRAARADADAAAAKRRAEREEAAREADALANERTAEWVTRMAECYASPISTDAPPNPRMCQYWSDRGAVRERIDAIIAGTLAQYAEAEAARAPERERLIAEREAAQAAEREEREARRRAGLRATLERHGDAALLSAWDEGILCQSEAITIQHEQIKEILRAAGATICDDPSDLSEVSTGGCLPRAVVPAYRAAQAAVAALAETPWVSAVSSVRAKNTRPDLDEDGEQDGELIVYTLDLTVDVEGVEHVVILALNEN